MNAANLPSASQYSDAIQNPKLCFSLPSLREGTLAVDRLGMPLVMAGNFAVVFKLRLLNGTRAVKCFCRFLGDREARFIAIDKQLDISNTVSQSQMTQRQQEIATGQLLPPANLDYNIEVELSDGSVYPKPGEFAFADRQVDSSTGTLKVAILFPNPGNVLRPGQYAKVRAVMSSIPGAVVIPLRAVNELQGNFQVAVVGPDNKVAVRTVKPGVKTGSLVVIAEGVQAGERVVVEGLQKVKDGMTVNPTLVSMESPTAAQAGQPAEPAREPAPVSSGKPVAGHEQ